MRVVVESPCLEHGEVERHWGHFPGRVTPSGNPERLRMDEYGWCDSGSRRVLTPGEFVLVEKVDGEWPGFTDEAELIAYDATCMADILDVLAVGEGS